MGSLSYSTAYGGLPSATAPPSARALLGLDVVDVSNTSFYNVWGNPFVFSSGDCGNYNRQVPFSLLVEGSRAWLPGSPPPAADPKVQAMTAAVPLLQHRVLVYVSLAAT